VSRVVLPVVETGPEAMFRLGEIDVEGDIFRGTMTCGDWLTGPSGLPLAAGLGVLVDDVLGYAIIADLPEERWSVSVEITLDVVTRLPAEGPVYADARRVHLDAMGGFATGRVVDGDGELIALTTQRGRSIPAPPDLVVEGSWGAPLHDGDLDRLLATRPDEPMVADEVLANEAGNLHGGVSMFLSGLVAETVAPHLTLASLHISYARPVPIGARVTWRPHLRHRGRSLAVVDVDGVVEERICTTARIVLHPAG
jgi:acyl-coenzyme A thioesterase PaaI-like protein